MSARSESFRRPKIGYY